MLTYHLGFPVKVLGAPLRACDTRRWQNQPHLSVSLAYLRDVFAYLDARAIHFYRLAGQLAPYVTHPDLPAFHHQLAECTTDLAAIGDLARQLRLRLTVHPAHYIQLNSPDASRVSRSTLELAVISDLLDAMGLGLDSVIVVHVGGVYGDPLAGRDRFAQVVDRLPEAVRHRLVIEHDDRRYSFEDALWIHRRTGTPIVLDTLHLRCLNPTDRPLAAALAAALDSWPPDRTPKVHFSSPRTALRTIHRAQGDALQYPLPNQHSDFIDPFTFVDFLRTAREVAKRPFDIMLEAKGKDLALLRLRSQIEHFAPELCEPDLRSKPACVLGAARG